MNPIFKVIFTLIPVSFMIQLFITEYMLLKKGIKIGGNSPINKIVFLITKYAVLIVWTGMVLEIWGIHVIFKFPKTPLFSFISFGLWILGFSLLYFGRFSLGTNFRIGIANEKTEFIVGGIYKISRNPMYVGLFITFFACILYSFNLLYVIISLLIVIVHHVIVLGEENMMTEAYGEAYSQYCKRVRRYL